MKLFPTFRGDVRRSYALTTEGTRLSRILTCVRAPGVHAIAVYRMRHWLRSRSVPVKLFFLPFTVYLDYRMRSRWGIEIQSGATIGEGFIIYHYGGIFVTGGATIGKDFSVAHDVTIGTGKNGSPTIGDNVSVHPGAKVFGGVAIGSNTHIGPNAIVDRDVPESSLVYTSPTKVVRFPSFYAPKEGPGAPADPACDGKD